MRKLICLVAFFISFQSIAQLSHTSELYKIMKVQDSLLFDIGFNTCDVSQFEKLISIDFEFYHDKSGITPSRDAFVKTIREGLCKGSYRATRKLVKNSLEVYPMENKGILYATIQTGIHEFYETEDGKLVLRSTAKFTHLWQLENGLWKLSRCLSYDHQLPKE